MKKKIFSSMLFIAVITAVFTTLLTTVVLFTDTRDEMHTGTKMEANYVIESYNEMGQIHLMDFSNVTPSRVTIISPDGTVIFDSFADTETMENHGRRPEVIAAFATGEGEATRRSGTLNEETYYYAVLLDDGNVFRISNQTGTVYTALLSTVPWMLAVTLIAVVIAAIASKLQTAEIVNPINTLDIDDPDEGSTYSELAPLIERLKRQHSQIDEQFAVLERQNHMRREFTANVSHELKTPLTSISGYAEIIQNGIAKPEDVGRFAGNIYNETQRLIHLVGDILKLSHLDEGAEGLETEDLDMRVVCRTVKNRLATQASAKGVVVNIDGESVRFRGVRSMIEEMVYNLCENAIKYNVKGGCVNMDVSFKDGKATLEISDTGIGIPEGDLDRVFERFYRVDKSHSKETGGTGLGLSIVKHCVMLHNGEISISSELNKGTTVTVRI